jgi:hypothetical protein
MRVRVGILFIVFAFLAPAAHAQDATVAGTVVDDSKAIMPGVTITAADQATGRQFVAVTGGQGEFRLPGMAPGRYQIQAELAGFASSTVQVELLVGQNATVNFSLKVASLSESITVSSEAPLVDTRTSQVAGNVDRRQMEALPIQGRNWMELSLMVKGVTGNDVSSQRVGGVGSDAQFQMNLDGQQITEQVAGAGNFGQPGLSRDAIAEYQIITNMFDVTMGRSAGLQLQAISKSGSNIPSGSVYGFFRDSKFNSPDFVAKRVLPYSNQQVGGTLGGPIAKDKLHYFVSLEREREPNTWSVKPPLYQNTITFPNKTTINNVLARGDYQVGSKDHLMARGTYYQRYNPFDQLTGTTYPSLASSKVSDSNFLTVNWSRVMSGNVLQEVRAGFFHYHWDYVPADGVVRGPLYSFPGLQIGARSNYPEEFWENTPSLRYDLAVHKGKHDLKIGGEYLRVHDTSCWPDRIRGFYTFRSVPADVERRFPLDAWNDPSRWDLSGLDSLALRYDQNVAELGGQINNCGDYSIDLPRPNYGLWFGDTWAMGSRFTLNYGVRYDVLWGDIATPGVNETELVINNGKFTENVGFRTEMRDLNNLAPRVGFSWNVTGNDDFTIRGGSGLFWGHNSAYFTLYQQLYNGQRIIANTWNNDGLPGFIQDPTRGVTVDDILSGEVRPSAQALYVIAHDYELPYTWQSTIGFQKQLSGVMGIDTDVIYWREYDQNNARDPNLFYDPVTGFNKHPNTFGRPASAFGPINLWESHGKSDYMSIATALTRRYRDNFQASLTYTLMAFKHDTGLGFVPRPNNPFDVGAEWARSVDFQRHTLRANGIWNLPWSIGLSGSFSFGSGNYFATTSPVNPYGADGTTRVLPDLTIIPRNNLKGEPLQKLDLRVTKDIRLAGRTKLSGIAEVFNVYNHANYGAYQTLISSPTYGQPTQSTSTTYLPRIWQFGLKVSF